MNAGSLFNDASQEALLFAIVDRVHGRLALRIARSLTALGAIDELAAAQSSSRAEVLRTTVAELLQRRREAAIDAQLEAGYAAQPPSREDQAWAALSVEGVQAADVDW